MKILFTGASSFTGFWFVKLLAGAGHEIHCPLRGQPGRYIDIRRQRVQEIKPLCRLVPDAPFGSESFLKLVRDQAFDLLCHHAAEVTDYKSPNFNTPAALENNTRNLATVLAAMKPRGLRGVVLTGSVFENDEGTGDVPLRAFSPYGLSKAMTYQCFRHDCHLAGVPLGKFVIPNPFGPFEEPRFTAYLMNNWRAGEAGEVKTPDYRRDNIHVDLLAEAYVQFARRIAESNPDLLKLNPSGYAERQGEFARRVAREVQSRTGWACVVNLLQQTDFSEPLERFNSEPATGLAPDWNEQKAWDAFVDFYAARTHHKPVG